MHEHMCPLCDEVKPCNDIGCEMMESSVCKDCYDPKNDEAPTVGQE